MKIVTECGSVYEVIDKETIRKNGVVQSDYILLGSIYSGDLKYNRGPQIRDFHRIKTNPHEFRVGEQLVFQIKHHLGNREHDLHLSTKIKKIRRT